MPVIQTKKGKLWKGLKKLLTGSLLVTGTAVAVFPRVLSHLAFPKDGTIVSGSLSYGRKSPLKL
ncbi:MAG: hypothetical protein KME26_06120 [Oscillatoria princeps RMCB-10]|jgi:hypothetical protein|nr:hypothetical protein [Oscillatoria princeps RMCB-10]